MNVPSCALDAQGMSEQGARLRRLAPSVTGVTRRPAALDVDFAPGFDRRTLDEMLEVERRCCPFLQLDFDDQTRRLTIGVDDPGHAEAVEAFRTALEATAAVK